MSSENVLQNAITMLRLTPSYRGGRMSQPVSNNNEPSKLNKLLNGKVDNSIKARLPRSTGTPPPPQAAPPVSTPLEPAPKARRFQLGPTFWTIASIISLLVNI